MGLASQLLKPRYLILVAVNSWIVYQLLVWYQNKKGGAKDFFKEPKLEPLPYREYILADLRKFDGIQDEHILVALDMRVFDVTSSKHLYGPGGSYAGFAGRDASRAMAQGKLMSLTESELQEYDYLLDLTPKERDTLNEWVDFFGSKYETVGTLLHYYLAENGSDQEGERGGGFLDKNFEFSDELTNSFIQHK